MTYFLFFALGALAAASSVMFFRSSGRENRLKAVQTKLDLLRSEQLQEKHRKEAEDLHDDEAYNRFIDRADGN
jgi:hypothetical protein